MVLRDRRQRRAGGRIRVPGPGRGRPHISYFDQTNASLKYAAYDGGQWNLAVVDGSAAVTGHTSLALDAAGQPHITYYDSEGADLEYVFFDGTAISDGAAWQTTTVDAAGVGQYASLALDAAGRTSPTTTPPTPP